MATIIAATPQQPTTHFCLSSSVHFNIHTTQGEASDMGNEPPPPLCRRNSISTSVPIPSELTLPPKPKPLQTSSLPNDTTPSFELISLRSSLTAYTSLKDILPSSAAVNSPTAGSAANSCPEISIRNRLVKQAAWAYLQPMSASPGSSSHHFFHRFWIRFSSAHYSLASCLRYIISGLSRAIHRIRRAIFVHVTR